MYALVRMPVLWTVLAYASGFAIRADYVLLGHRPQDFVYSDMQLYVQLAKRLAKTTRTLMPWDVTHPLAFPGLLAELFKRDETLQLAANVQLAVCALIPLAAGLLGAAAFGRRTGLLVIAATSLYFPYIDYGGFFLSEVHFIFWLALAFAGLLAAKRASSVLGATLWSVAAGFALSIASAFKSVAIPAAVCFVAVDGLAALLSRSKAGEPSLLQRLGNLTLRSAVAAVFTLPVLVPLARICTAANRGIFCVSGNKVGADFLLGHYGRIAGIQWGPDKGHNFRFGSPGAYLRHYSEVPNVPFPLTDTPANAAEAWKWVGQHPLDAVVLSLDHVYDTFFGVAAWPSYATTAWRWAHLAQYTFLLFLFVPTVIVCERLLRGGVRHVLTSRTLLVLSPLVALAVTVAIATGEVRYRIPFDLFFIVTVAAFIVGDLRRVDGYGEPRTEPHSAPLDDDQAKDAEPTVADAQPVVGPDDQAREEAGDARVQAEPTAE